LRAQELRASGAIKTARSSWALKTARTYRNLFLKVYRLRAPSPTDAVEAIIQAFDRYPVDPMNHPEMSAYETHLKEAIRSGQRKQDPLNPQKYRYAKAFEDLAEDNTHIIAIVLFRFSEGPNGEPVPNNFIVTAYQKEIG